MIGAGAANHITGTGDAVLRRTDLNNTTHVIGVAFESSKTNWSEAAILSITCVPATSVIYDGYAGKDGFTRACEFAAYGELPVIELPTVFKKPNFFSREEAIARAEAN